MEAMTPSEAARWNYSPTSGTHVLDPPAVIGSHEVVLHQRVFVGVENDVEPDVSIDVERHLPTKRRVLCRGS